MDRHKCAILIATFNGEEHIKDQILSVLNQKEVELNIFVSDDNSSDNTLKIIRDLPYKNIEIICRDRKGSAAKNFINFFNNKFKSKFNKFDYFALCDQDDIWPDNHLINSIKLIKKNKFDLTGVNVETFGKGNYKKVIKYNQKQTKYDYLFQGLSPGFTFVFTKRLFLDLCSNLNEYRNFNLEYHDWFIYSFSRQKNYRSFVRDFDLLKYRQHQNNHTGSRKTLKGILWRLMKVFNAEYKNIILKNSYLLKNISGESNFITNLNEGRASIKSIINVLIFSRRITFERFITVIPIIQILFSRNDSNNK
tara:strand:- start:9875 stop:10795 length:921 start_codon:yes stop_codon:yes gene_type:complete